MAAAIASIVEISIDFMSAGSLSREERIAQREEARKVLEAADHDEGLGYYWWDLGGESGSTCARRDRRGM